MQNLENKTDKYLVRKVQKENCEDSLKILINRHTPICFKIYKKYIASFNIKNIDVNEIYQQKDYIIYRTIKSFKNNKKTKFSTWLANQIRYQCLNAINKKEDLTYMNYPELQFIIDKAQPKDNNNEKLNELREYINSLLQQLKDRRISKIFNMRYFETDLNQTWTKIGKRMNMSTQNAINLHNKGVRILKNKLTSKDLFDRI
jgi:RNA polymerase sigma factor (sigma-70 family)